MLDAFLDLTFGGACASCGEPGRVLCAACAACLPLHGVPVHPEPPPPGLAPTYAAGWYADPWRALVLAHKERRALALTRPLGAVLAGVVATALEPCTVEDHVAVVLVPVPSSPGAVQRRGHDPVLRMVRAAAAALAADGLRVSVRPLLAHRGAVADQAGLDASGRAANLAGQLRVVRGEHRRLARAGRPVRLVLCDDVITTGATAREAQRALADLGLPLTGIATLAATRRRTRVAGPSGRATRTEAT